MTQRSEKKSKREKFRSSRETAAKKLEENPINSIKLVFPLIIALLAIVLYANTSGHQYTLDDYSVIIENRQTRQGVSAIPEIFTTSYRYGYFSSQDELYRPIPKAMFAAEWQIGKGSPLPGHLINIFLYALTGILLFITFKDLSSGNQILAFITAILFIAHPIHTEVVANIKSRDEILSFLFAIWSLHKFHKWITKNKSGYLIHALILFFIGLMSKESSITFLAIYPVSAYFFAKSSFKKSLIKTLPFLGVAAVFLVIRSLVLKDMTPSNVSIADNLLMAANTYGDRFATAVLILGKYITLLIFPHPLVFDYSYNQIPIVGPTNGWFLLSVLIHSALVAIMVWLFRSRHIISFSILFYLITFSIYSNLIITIGSSMGERFLYTSTLGLCLVIAYLFQQWGTKNADQSDPKWFSKNIGASAVLLLILGAYSFKTTARNRVWKDNLTLYSNDVLLSPNSTRTQYYLGNLLVKPESWNNKDEEGKRVTIEKALAYLRRSVEIYPEFSDAYLQMGVGYYQLKDYKNALGSYMKAYELNPGNPTTNNNIGTIYFETGEYNTSLKYFLDAVKYNPAYSEAYANAGSTYGVLQKFDDAINMFNQAVLYDPGYAQAYYFLGITYRNIGNETMAQKNLLKATELDPSYAQFLK